MAHITLNYLSKTLGMHQTINVILPEDKSYFDTNENAKPLKTMLLLHGLSSDTSSYMSSRCLNKKVLYSNFTCMGRFIVEII